MSDLANCERQITRSFNLLITEFLHRVSPGECSFTSSDGNPGTNGVILKTRCGVWNKDQSRDFATPIFGRARLCRANKFQADNATAQRSFAVPINSRQSHRAVRWRMSIFSGNIRPALRRCLGSRQRSHRKIAPAGNAPA